MLIVLELPQARLMFYCFRCKMIRKFNKMNLINYQPLCEAEIFEIMKGPNLCPEFSTSMNYSKYLSY